MITILKLILMIFAPWIAALPCVVWITKRGRPLLGTAHVYQGHVVALVDYPYLPSHVFERVTLKSQDGVKTEISLMRFNIVRRRCSAGQIEAVQSLLGVGR